MSSEDRAAAEDLYAEDFDLDDDPAPLGELFAPPAGDAQDPDDLVEFDGAETRRQDPQFGPLAEEENGRPKLAPLDAPEGVFDEDGSEGSTPKGTEDESGGGGFFSDLKRVAQEEWNSQGEDDTEIANQEGGSHSYDESIHEGASTEPPPLLPNAGSRGESEKRGPIAFIRTRWEQAKAMQREDDQGDAPVRAGVDIGPNSIPRITRLLQRARARASSMQDQRGRQEEPPAQSSGADEFGELLTPLSGSQIALLQADLESDETIFTKVDRAQNTMAARQRIGLLIGISVISLIAISSGNGYLLDTLPAAAQPSWIPEAARGDIAGALLYAIGLILPLVSVFVIADGVRFSLNAIFDRRIEDILLGFTAGTCAIGALSSCLAGQVISGALFLAIYGIVHIFAKALGVRNG